MSAWKRQLLDAVPEVFAKGGRRKHAKEHEAKIHDLHAKIGELTVERANSEHRVFPYLLRGLGIARADRGVVSGHHFCPCQPKVFLPCGRDGLGHRPVLSWWLSNTMDAAFCIGALDDALVRARPEILNTDQGSQFISAAFVERIIGSWTDFYNEVRPHSSLGGRTPGETYRNGTTA